MILCHDLRTLRLRWCLVLLIEAHGRMSAVIADIHKGICKILLQG